MLGLHCCTQAFSSCGERGLLFIVVYGLLIAVVSLVAHTLSCPMTCGFFPDQESNSCPLHWQADSQPLDHQGSPPISILSSWIWQNKFLMSSPIVDVTLFSNLCQWFGTFLHSFWWLSFSSVQSLMSGSLQPHGLQHARLPCPSPTPRAYSNSCP